MKEEKFNSLLVCPVTLNSPRVVLAQQCQIFPSQFLSPHIHTSTSSGIDLGQSIRNPWAVFYRWNENKAWFARGAVLAQQWLWYRSAPLVFYKCSWWFYCNCTGSRKSATMCSEATNTQQNSLCNPGISPANSSWNTGMDVYKPRQHEARLRTEKWVCETGAADFSSTQSYLWKHLTPIRMSLELIRAPLTHTAPGIKQNPCKTLPLARKQQYYLWVLNTKVRISTSGGI